MLVSYSPSGHNYRLMTQNAFGGINNNIGADEGEIISAINMSADSYPALSTRKEGIAAVTLPENAKKLYAFKMIDGKAAYILYEERAELPDSYWVYLWYDGHRIGKIYDEPVTEANIKAANIVKMGDLLCIYGSDRAAGKFSFVYDLRAEIVYITGNIYPNDTLEFIKDNPRLFPDVKSTEGSIVEAQYQHVVGDVTITEMRFYIYSSGAWTDFTPFYKMEWNAIASAQFTDGTLSGTSAIANTIKINKPSRWAYNDRLKAGDAVTITKHVYINSDEPDIDASNYKTAIIREVYEDTNYVYLRFSEHTWVNSAEMDSIEINRNVPEMFCIFEHDNRLWGFSDKQIFCSRLGDPVSWYTYESTADSSWAAEISSGKLTGGFSYRYPLFFSEDKIYTILGSEPDNFTFSITPSTYGCADGSWDSFAIVGTYLYYHSPWGFVVYAGSRPQLISKSLGIDSFRYAHAGGAGNKYYVTCDDVKGNAHCFVYDALRGLWHEQTAIKDTSYAASGNAVYSATWHSVWKHVVVHNYSDPDTEFDGEMPSSVVFAPMHFSSIRKKQIKTICIRHEVEGQLKVKLFEDGAENKSFTALLTGKGVTEITGRPTRSDEFSLEFEGIGQWKVFSIAFEYWEGSIKP